MTQIAFTGNITSPPELRFTQSGKAVANVTVAVNRKKGETEETDFHRVTLWEDLATNAAQLDKGTRVVVIGRLTSRDFEDKEGNKRTAWEVTADAFGPDLRFAQAAVTRTARAQSPSETPAAEPWASTPPEYGSGSVAGADGFTGYNDESPF